MAAYSDAGNSRKRIATYGKALRKHLHDHITFNSFQELNSTKPASRASYASSLPADNPHRNSSYSLSPTLSANADMFEVPSSDDEAIHTPQKRRKLLRPASALKAELTKDSAHTNHLIAQQQTHRIPAEGSRKTAPKHGQKQQLSSRVPKQDSAFSTSSVMASTTPGSFKKAIGGPRTSVAQRSKDLVKDAPRRYQRTVADFEDEVMQSINNTPLTSLHPRKSPPFPHQDVLVTTPERRASTPDSPSQTNSGPGSTLFRTTPAILTPRGLQMWQGLLGDDDDEVLDSTISETATERTRAHGEAIQNGAHNSKLPRRRLIDSLVEQSHIHKPVLDLRCGSDSENSKGWSLAPDDLKSEDHMLVTTQARSLPTGSANNNGMGLSASGSQILQTSATKFTYSRQRSILAEQDVLKDTHFNVPIIEGIPDRTSQKRRGSVPVLAPLQSLHEKPEAEDGNAGVAIRTIHELRHAGAQTRFKDEVEDLFDRIGSPTQQRSVRRSALMDLAGKMRDRSFMSDFLNNGMDHSLFLHLGQEEDVISGFILISLLMTMLENGLTAVAVVHLRRHGISRLLMRLIGVDDSILSIAKDRKSNMSKSAQSLLSELHRALLDLKVWDDMRALSISPRTASLRCLELMARQNREAGDTEDLLSEELMGKLFTIVKLSPDSRSEKTNAIDFQLALTILESYSFNPSMSTEEYLPIIRDLLKDNLESTSENATVALLLRLVLNITNNSSTASEVFASPDLLHLMCRTVIEKFKMLTGSILELERLVMVDQLVLMLVVMINILELSLHAVACFERFQDNTLDDLVQIFLENNEKAYEADSVEDSHLNVAGGYLAVLLGYLSLSADNMGIVAVRQRTNTLQALITCIDEFIGHHKKVDDLFKDDVKHNPQAGLTDKLQSLVDKLKEKGRT